MDRPWIRHYQPGVPATVEYPDKTLPDLLDQAADKYPEKIALRFFLRSLSVSNSR